MKNNEDLDKIILFTKNLSFDKSAEKIDDVKEYIQSAGYVRTEDIKFRVRTKDDLLKIQTPQITVGDYVWVTDDNISFDKETNYGTYISKLEPGTKTIPHIHKGYEEFFILEGELIDSDGTIFNKGDFVTFEPGTKHSSHTEKGCLILTFMRGENKRIKEK